MNLLQTLEQEELTRVMEGKNMPDFAPGDTLRVNVRIIEGNTERTQAFEGVCIGRKNAGLNSSVTVRKMSHGEGVERIFPIYSPRLESIEVVRRGVARRAKLYYLRERTGKAARIAERRDFREQEPKAAQASTAKAESKPASESAPKKAKKA